VGSAVLEELLRNQDNTFKGFPKHWPKRGNIGLMLVSLVYFKKKPQTSGKSRTNLLVLF
jgi:hypothetical protein